MKCLHVHVYGRVLGERFACMMNCVISVSCIQLFVCFGFEKSNNMVRKQTLSCFQWYVARSKGLKNEGDMHVTTSVNFCQKNLPEENCQATVRGSFTQVNELEKFQKNYMLYLDESCISSTWFGVKTITMHEMVEARNLLRGMNYCEN